MEEKEKATWLYWIGWQGNHDQRIEDAICSRCGYEHETVYQSLDNLSEYCPRCGRIMSTK